MAQEILLTAQKRDAVGTRVSRHLRSKGQVPCIMLQKKEKPLHLLIDAREFGKILKKGARLLDLKHPGGSDRVFIKEVQYDHLGDQVYHVDFSKIAMDELLKLEVELVLKGKPVGVTEEGAALDQYVKMLTIECLPTAIPERIEIDVTPLKKDDRLTIKDIKAPPGVKLLQDPDVVVAAVTEHKLEEVVPAAAVVPGAAEPEVIKKEKAEDEVAEGDAKKEGAPKKEAAPKKEEKK